MATVLPAPLSPCMKLMLRFHRSLNPHRLRLVPAPLVIEGEPVALHQPPKFALQSPSADR